MEQKTIKSIAYACADSFNIKYKDKSLLWQGFRNTGEYWGDVPIDDKLTKTVFRRLKRDKSVEKDKLTAIYSFDSWMTSMTALGLFSHPRTGNYTQFYCACGDPTCPFLIRAFDENLDLQHNAAIFLERSNPHITEYEEIHISWALSMLNYLGIKDTGGDFVDDGEDGVTLINAKRHLFDHPISLYWERYRLEGNMGGLGYPITTILRRALKLKMLAPAESVIVIDLIKHLEYAVKLQENENKARHNKAVAQFYKAVNKMAETNHDRMFLLTHQ